MRLLGRTSSINVRKVMWTAAEIGLRYAHEHAWGTASAPTNSPAFRRYNPNALVPVWIDDDCVLWESNTICRYLAARGNRIDLLPWKPLARAEVERWMDWSAGELMMAWRFPFMWLVRGDERYRDDVRVARGAAEWNALMAVLDGHLARIGPYVTGPAFTLADVTVGLAIHRWTCTPIERPPLENVEGYLELLRLRPGFARLATPELP